jgi:phosphoenolpyruvate carboxylase
MHGEFNSSITGSAYALGVPPHALAAFVQNWENGEYISTPASTLETLTEQMATEVSRTNPTLAQRWRLFKLLRERQDRAS